MSKSNWKQFSAHLNDIRDRIKAAGVGAFVPLWGMLAFYGLFAFCAGTLELKQPLWPVVETNVLTARANAAAKVTAPNSSGSTDQKEVKQKPAPATKEFAIRLLWSLSGLLFSFLCLALIARSFRLMVAFVLERKIWFLILALLGAGGFAFQGCDHGFDVPDTAGGMAGEQLLRAIARSTNGLGSNSVTFDLLQDAETERLVAVKHVGWLANAFSSFAKVGLFSIALAASCILIYARTRKDEPLKSDDNIRLIVTRYEKLGNATNLLLHLAACALVCGVLEVYLLYMMASYHVRETLHVDVQYFALTLTTAAGIVYSGFLVAIFFPLYTEQKAFKQRLHAAALSGEQTESAEKKSSREPEAHDDAGDVPLLKSLLKILSPVLAAFATLLATYLTEFFK